MHQFIHKQSKSTAKAFNLAAYLPVYVKLICPFINDGQIWNKTCDKSQIFKTTPNLESHPQITNKF